MPKRIVNLLPVIFTALLAMSLDLWTKDMANHNLVIGKSFDLLPSVLKLTLVTNKGAAFGLGRDQASLMTILSAAILSSIFIWIIKKANFKFSLLEIFAYGLLLGGGLGNLFEKLTVGRVTDFFEFAFVSFPVFNLADVLIDIGLGLLIIANLSAGNKEDANE